MALLFCESWDWTTTQSHAADRYSFLRSGGFGTIVAGAGRRGTNGFRHVNQVIALTKTLSPADATCIVGFARNSNVTTASDMVTIADASVTHILTKVDTDGTVRAYRGAGTTLLGSSAAGAYPHGLGYVYVEVYATIHDSAGVVKIAINGLTVLNLTGIDTRNGGTAGWTNFSISTPGSVHTTDLDDIYCCDGSGTRNNNFLGDTRIDVHRPDSDGSHSDSTPSAGTDRYATVDDTTPSATDYNSLVNVGDKDTLGLQSLIPTGRELYGVQVSAMALKSDAGTARAAIAVRSGGNDYDGTERSLDVSQGQFLREIYDGDPNGDIDWTESAFNAFEVGYKRTA